MTNDKNIDDAYEWRKIEEFVEGDILRAGNMDNIVTGIKVFGKVIRLYYIHDGKDKYLNDNIGNEYRARKREA